MALVSSRSSDNGLGYLATCDCADFEHRGKREQAMTQKEINSRLDRARDKLRVSCILGSDDYYGVKVEGGEDAHGVIVSKGEKNVGPNFLCAHCLCALRLILKEAEGLDVLAFGCLDTELPPGQFETISIDGWMVALIEKRKEKRG